MCSGMTRRWAGLFSYTWYRSAHFRNQCEVNQAKDLGDRHDSEKCDRPVLAATAQSHRIRPQLIRIPLEQKRSPTEEAAACSVRSAGGRVADHSLLESQQSHRPCSPTQSRGLDSTEREWPLSASCIRLPGHEARWRNPCCGVHDKERISRATATPDRSAGSIKRPEPCYMYSTATKCLTQHVPSLRAGVGVARSERSSSRTEFLLRKAD